MDPADAVYGFLLAYSSDGHSIHTIASYERRLKVFVQYFKDKDIEKISLVDLRGFFEYLRKDYRPAHPGRITVDFSQSSHLFYWRTIRVFYNWGEREFHWENISKNLAKPFYKQPEVLPFSEEEIKSLLMVTTRYRYEYLTHGKKVILPSPVRHRNMAIMMPLMVTGMRVGELVRLKVRDVNLNNGEIFIAPFSTGMKTKSRHVYIGSSTKNAIWKYLTQRKRRNTPEHPDDPLFMTVDRKEMQRNAVSQMLRWIGRLANVSHVYPHRFRHTAAVQYLKNDGDIFTLQRMLGHSRLNMIRYYLTLADIDLKDVHMRVSPVDRWHLS